MRLAFDSRPTADPQGLGRYSRGLLQALRDTADEHDEILESHRPRGADLFHTPWVQGAMLHSPCPMVVTIYDIAALKRPSERLRGGGMHLHLRHLALQRASHVIVPSEVVAREAVAEFGLEHERLAVIPEAPDPVASDGGVGRARSTGRRGHGRTPRGRPGVSTGGRSPTPTGRASPPGAAPEPRRAPRQPGAADLTQ